MKAALKVKLRSVKHASTIRVDPRAPPIAGFELVRAGFKDQDYQLERGSSELQVVRYAVSDLLRRLLVLARLLEGYRWAYGPDFREFDQILESLFLHPTQDDLVAAMDSASDAVEGMLEEFSQAEFPRIPNDLTKEEEKEREHARYKCAALLPLLVQLMADVWAPLRKKILQVDVDLRT